MRLISESKAIANLADIRREFAAEIAEYEHRARSCAVCPTPGACCLDEHFVNIRITRLEAAAISKVIAEMPEEKQIAIRDRVENASAHLDAEAFFACPLYERGSGCLVHQTAKPLPCIAHACYEKKEDLPPDELLAERETEIAELNRRVYGKVTRLPLPPALRRGL